MLALPSQRLAWTLGASRAVYAASYVAAGVVAAATILLLPGLSPVARAIAGGASATIFLYGCGVLFKNSGFYDVYWSVFPMLASLGWMSAYDAWSRPRAWIALFISALWGIRLTTNWVKHFG